MWSSMENETAGRGVLARGRKYPILPLTFYCGVYGSKVAIKDAVNRYRADSLR